MPAAVFLMFEALKSLKCITSIQISDEKITNQASDLPAVAIAIRCIDEVNGFKFGETKDKLS